MYSVPSSQGEGRFKERIDRFINLEWGIVTVIIIAFISEIKLFAAAVDPTRLKMSNLSRLRK
jgi:hypothetical protein